MRSTLASSLPNIHAESTNPSGTDESSVPANQILRSVSSALLVGTGYYIGTRIGLALTPSGQPNSAFWPPNALLLAAFLLAPRRIWWTFLLAVFPAHMFAQLQTGVPVWTAVGWFITNTSEAFIGAFCITRLTPHNMVLDSVRGVLIFVAFGVLIVPLATSFLDAAAVVITHWGRGYWPLGAERFWTNALAELTVVPTIVVVTAKGVSWIGKASVARCWEAGLLTVGTVLVSVLVFGLQPVSPATIPALLYAPLPFLLWATIRFGSGGLSLSLLCTVLISIWYTMHGRAPLPYASLRQNILSLQILFCMVAVPLMFLSAVMAEARRTQESVRRLGVRLIEGQEQERNRIARELHDDIGQRLALLAVELDQLHLEPPESPELLDRMGELQKQASEIATDTQTLSHDLHSGKPEHLSPVVAMRSLCQELGEHTKVKIEFKTQDLPSPLAPDISLCLFRVLQEALRNAIKHSGAQHVEVGLWRTSDEIHLAVSDRGVGFDSKAAKAGRGLGLVSMEERLKLLKGSISIESRPNRGTTIHARLPLSSKSDSVRAAW